MKTASELKIFKSNDYEYIYIYYKQNCLVRINTKYTIVKNGMTKGMLYKNTVPDYKRKNDHIILMKQRVDKYISDQLLSNSGSGEITQKDAHNAAFNIKPENSDQVDRKLLIPFFDSYFAKLNKENNYRPTTITYYNNLKARLEEYGTEVLKHKLLLADFNSKDSLINFCNFLGEKRGMNDNSISKRLNSLKAFLEDCTGESIYSYDPSVFTYKVKKYETGIVALSFEELQQLIDLKIENPSWKKIMDVFICNCFMGLRISDLSRLSKANFSADDDGDYKYMGENRKTGTSVSIPIIEIPLKILKNYDFKLPSYTGQYFNRQLQKILEHYKLFEDEVVVGRKVFKQKTENKVLKRTIITSHTCRKTFITFCVMSLLPLNVIMKASGHKQLETMQAYIQKAGDKEQFKKLNKKVNDSIKKTRKKNLKAQNEIDNLSRPVYQRL
jgi:integrase